MKIKSKWLILAGAVVVAGLFAAFGLNHNNAPQHFTAKVEKGEIHDDNSSCQNEPFALYFHFLSWNLRNVCFIHTAAPQWDRAERLFARGNIQKKLPLLRRKAPPQ